MSAEGTSNFCFSVSNTLPTPAASFASSPIPPMCMNGTRGVSQKKWLWRAGTSSPFCSAASIAGFTWSSVRTMSPITTVCVPALVNAAQAVRPRGGVSLAPAAVTARSLRATCTLKTPCFSFHCPFSPVSCSILAVSNLAAVCPDRPAAPAGETHAGEAKQFFPPREGARRARQGVCDRPTWTAIATEIGEVQLVQRSRVRERQLALFQRRDRKRCFVLVDARQLL